MENLSKNQQSIIDSLISEFVTINNEKISSLSGIIDVESITKGYSDKQAAIIEIKANNLRFIK